VGPQGQADSSKGILCLRQGSTDALGDLCDRSLHERQDQGLFGRVSIGETAREYTIQLRNSANGGAPQPVMPKQPGGSIQNGVTIVVSNFLNPPVAVLAGTRA
jgi:hypothetical protein